MWKGRSAVSDELFFDAEEIRPVDRHWIAEEDKEY